MKILLIGDIVGKAGVDCLKEKLPVIKKIYNIDFVSANIENASGTGIDKKAFKEIEELGIDSYTLGNHTWGKLDGFEIVKNEKVSRPGNLSKGVPGKAYRVFEKNGVKIAIVNLIGRIEMNLLSDNPFPMMDILVKKLNSEGISTIILDFHAEATSEKKTMGFFMDGKITAVVGTHTHVQTADECILENGTAYITDVGMTGIQDSVLGMKKDVAFKRFLKCLPERYVPETVGKGEICAVVIDVDEKGKARDIQRIRF